jgi:hypothetical protein
MNKFRIFVLSILAISYTDKIAYGITINNSNPATGHGAGTINAGSALYGCCGEP